MTSSACGLQGPHTYWSHTALLPLHDDLGGLPLSGLASTLRGGPTRLSPPI